MCQSGAFPLAAMERDSKVKGVVISQPALPLGEAHQGNVGISDTTMQMARDSGIPILAFRFGADKICKAARFNFLKCYFKAQFDGHTFDCPDFHFSVGHTLHAVLTGPCRDVREKARTKVIKFLCEELD